MAVETILIGLDGATFSALDPLMQEGVMPFLREFVASGVSAGLRSVIPALTPPAWTSLATGRSPGQHGIFDFFQKSSGQDLSIRIATARDIGCPTIWDLAEQGGKRSLILNFPLTFPPPPIDGYVVPGWMPWRQLRLGCHPPGLYDRLKSLPGFNPRELAMDMALEEKTLEGCGPDEYEDWIALHIRRERRWLQILTELLSERDPCQLVAVVFDGVDKLQHLCWRFIDPAFADTIASPADQRIHALCLDYFRQLDGILATLVQMVGPNATVVVVSDHGFGPQVRTFFVNAWLEDQGYLAWKGEHAPLPSERQVLGISQVARHAYLLDWERTLAYAPLPSGNGIHIVRRGPEHPNGVSDEDYESLRDRIADGLLALREPDTGTPIVAEVWKREDVHAGPHQQLAPDLTLVLEDGGLISILASDVLVRPRPQPTGAHRPVGVFAARGPAIRPGQRLPEVSILDVTPLVLYSLGLAIPPELQGQLPVQILDDSRARSHPVQQSIAPLPDRTGRSPADSGSGLDEAGEEAILQRLRALGYID